MNPISFGFIALGAAVSALTGIVAALVVHGAFHDGWR